MDEPKLSSKKAAGLRIIFDALQKIADEDVVTLEKVLIVLGKKSTAALIFIVAFLIALPAGLFPGFAGVMAVIILILSTHLLTRAEKLWLPKRLRRIQISGRHLKHTLEKAAPVVNWLEQRTGRRLVWIAEGRFSDYMAGAVICVLAIILILFGWIPFAGVNAIPIMLIAAGLFVRDGIIYLIGYALSLLAIGLVVTLGLYAINYINGNTLNSLSSWF